MDFAQDGTRADHAYWLSDLRLRDATANSGLGNIDVRSEAFGTGDPTASGTNVGAGALTGGNLPALAYERQYQTWGAVPSTPVADRLDIKAANITRVVVDPARARVDCSATLNVTSDGPLEVVLAGCGRSASVVAGTTILSVSAGGASLPNGARSDVSAAAPAICVALLLVLAPIRRRARLS
jgi:hypothetical protein